jgi:hypothetical protein
MDNRVGDNAPNDQRFGELKTQLDVVLEEFRKFGALLTSDYRKQLTHPRIGAEKHVVQVATLSGKYNVVIPKIPRDGMLADLRLAKAMHPLVETIGALYQYAQDTEGQAGHEYWQAFLAHYGVLASMATRDADLETEMKSVIEFMATGKRPKAPEPAK